MALRLITPASTMPVSLDEAKNICRIDGTDHDAQLTLCIASATQAAEHRLGRALVSATYEQSIDAFPDGEIALGKPDVSSIVSVKYVINDVHTTMAPGGYALDTASEYESWLFPLDDWPTADSSANSVRVRFVVGYGTASDVPEAIKMWILFIVRSLFFSEQPPSFIDSMLDGYKVLS